MLLLAGAIHYYVVRGRLQPEFSGLDIGSDEGWEHIGSIITMICRQTLIERA